MAKTPQTLVKPYNFEEYYPQNPFKSSARSLIAFVFSILLYTSVFYIFNLSPSTLFYNSKFWFAISNTLVLIIAADYSSSKDKHNQINHQEEYMMHRQAQTTTSSFVSEYPREIVKETISDHQVAHQNIEIPENRQPVLEDEHDEKPSVDELDVREKRIVHVQSKGRKKRNLQAKTYKRSKSEEVKRVAMDECKSSIIMSSETMEKHEEAQRNTQEEENEFSSMSTEELNRRFEEFIQRFNEQIRHQSVADRRPELTYHHVESY
ncbi:uncharacterized protein LOC126785959 [Argentina anserina]|uniref:uncharacterized protein LOC126785959 n=1 Tax=Argentina anserina TaxID=57926 RepID=UPI0021766D0C|nr:uncharacterized protein LOC126785959 [Potentilla anserina]